MALMAISMFCEGGHFVLMPAHCADIFGSSARGVKAFSFLFSSFGICSLFGGLLSGKIQEMTNEPFKHIVQISQILSIIAMVTLVYYGNVLKSQDTDNKVIDDEFQKVEELEIRQVAEIEEMSATSSVLIKKQILRTEMIESVEILKKRHLDMSIGGMDDTESTYSNTTRNTNNNSPRNGVFNSKASDNMSSQFSGRRPVRTQSRVFSPFKP